MKIIKRDYEDGYHNRFLYRESANSQRNQTRLSLLLEYKQSGRLLEIGCGTGGFLSLAKMHFEIEGLDLSRQTIQSIQPQFGECVRAANIEQTQLPPNQYDVVVALNILEHLQRPEKAVAKIFRSLRSGGLLLGSVPYNEHLVGKTVTRIGNYIDRTHVSTFPPDAWMRIFAHAGFKDILFFGEIPFGRNRCRYLRGESWPHFAFNLMFVCQ